MANLNEIKAQIIALDSTNQDWIKWANSQKRVENLCDGEELKEKSKLDEMFANWLSKKTKATPQKAEISESIKSIIDGINEINDINEFGPIKKAIDERIKAINEAQQKERIKTAKAALKALKESGYNGFDIDEILSKLN